MKNFKLLSILLLILFCTIGSSSMVQAQGAQKVFNEVHDAYFDSLRNMDYPYIFPILGKGASKKGYDLPYAWGMSGIYFTQTQEININQTSVGINDSELVDVSEFITFGPTIAATNAYSVRPDLWVLPFLNLYGMLGWGTTETNVTLLSPVAFETSQKFGVSSFGLGATLSGAIGPIFVVWDNNYNFADVAVVVEPVPAYNSSVRFGHVFPDYKHPERNLSIWVGLFYQNIQSDTKGSILVSDLLPNLGSGAAIDDLNEWADGLPPAQRIVVKEIIQKIEDAAEGTDLGNSSISYQLEKEVAAPVNLILGAQYQFNKNWMLRSEVGTFGKRSQFLLNLNYRFASFFKKKS